MSSSDTAISIRGISKAYTIAHGALKRPTFRDVVMDRVRHPFHKPRTETFWALKDVSFDVKQGEVVGIIGRNGTGKSTLLKILSRITEPTSGRIELYGRVGSLLEVGTGFHPELTGRENVFLNGAILGMSRSEIRKQFDAIVDFAEVEKFIDTPVKRYSSGMYVRLAFAVAAHLNPEILIVDEVLAVGDAEFQKKCLGKMGEVAKGGRTVLFVSHNMAAVQQLCTQCALLEGGKIRLMGSASECTAAYAIPSHSRQDLLCAALCRNPGLKLTDIKINGRRSSPIELSFGQCELEVEIRGCLAEAARIDIEASISDSHGTKLGFFSPGHETGITQRLEPGQFCLNRPIKLPSGMNKIRLLLSLTLAQHNVAVWADLPECAEIIVDGTPTATGRVLDSADIGWLLLPSAGPYREEDNPHCGSHA